MRHLVSTVQPYGGQHNVTGPLAQLRIGQDPVDQNVSLLKERSIRITAGRDCFLIPATKIVDRVRRATEVRITAQTVRNTLKACRFKSRRPPKGVDLTVHHKRQRHAWVNQHMRRNRRAVLFSDGSRFTLKFAIDRMCVWRRPGERFAEICFIPVDRFGGGSLIVWPVWRNALRRKDQLAWDKTNTECTALL